MIDENYALKLAREAFDGSTSYFDNNIRPGVERDIRQFQSRHAADSKYSQEAYRSRSRLFRPKTRAAVRKNEAIAAEAFFSTIDTVSVSAVDETNERQVISAEVQKALLEHRLQKTLPWFVLAMAAYQEAMVCGVVVSYQSWKWDPDKKVDRPDIELLPIENFRFDPGANWLDPIGTSPYLIRLIPMWVKDVRARMKPQQGRASARWRKVSDGELLSAAKSYDTTRMVREDNRTDSRDAITSLTEYTLVWIHQNVVEVDGKDYVYFTLGTTLLLSEPEPLDKRYAHGKRPFVLGMAAIEAHRVYPSSPVRLTRDVQAEINDVANQRMDNVKLVLNKRYFVKRNKQIDIRSLTRNVAGSVSLMNDPEGDVRVVDTPDVTASSFQEHDRLNLDFDEVAGQFSNSSVSSNRRLNETVGGLNLLTNDASQLTRYQLKTFVETWVEPVLRQIVLLEQFYETDDLILALVASKVGLFQRFGIDQITDDMLANEASVKVDVGMGATNPNEKINNLMLGLNGLKSALAEGVLERYGIDPVALIKEVLGALGHRDGGKFMAKGEEDPAISALKQEIEALRAELEAKMPKQLLDATVSKLNAETDNVKATKVKTGVEAAFGAMQAAEVVTTLPAVSAVADKVMEIAGYQRPTPYGVDPNMVPAGSLVEPAMEAINSGATSQLAQFAQAGGGAGVGKNTSPMQPAIPKSAASGMNQGIETMRADSAGL